MMSLSRVGAGTEQNLAGSCVDTIIHENRDTEPLVVI